MESQLKNITVLAFGHKTRRGKDLSVNAIIRERGKDSPFGLDIRRYSFADALKREVAQINAFEWCLKHGIPYDQTPDQTDPLCGAPHFKQRALLQWWGTEYRRKQDPLYWVVKLYETLMAEMPKVALISDMRFKNEFTMVKSVGGYTCRLDRIGYQDLDPKVANHPSEIDLDNPEKDPLFEYDYIVQALDGDPKEVEKCALQVFDWVQESMKPKTASVTFPEAAGDPPNLIIHAR